MVVEELGEEAEREVPDRRRGRPTTRPRPRARSPARRTSASSRRRAGTRPTVGASGRPASGRTSRLKRSWSRIRPQKPGAAGSSAGRTARAGCWRTRTARRGEQIDIPISAAWVVDPELVEQRREAGVVAVVVDDEAGVDPALAARVVDADRVRVAADAPARPRTRSARAGGRAGEPRSARRCRCRPRRRSVGSVRMPRPTQAGARSDQARAPPRRGPLSPRAASTADRRGRR